jgi:hypothetical protein
MKSMRSQRNGHGRGRRPPPPEPPYDSESEYYYAARSTSASSGRRDAQSISASSPQRSAHGVSSSASTNRGHSTAKNYHVLLGQYSDDDDDDDDDESPPVSSEMGSYNNLQHQNHQQQQQQRQTRRKAQEPPSRSDLDRNARKAIPAKIMKSQAAAVRSEDPPDEALPSYNSYSTLQSIGRNYNSRGDGRGGNTNRRQRSKSRDAPQSSSHVRQQSTGSARRNNNKRNHHQSSNTQNTHNEEHPLFDTEKDQYEQYQDQLFHQEYKMQFESQSSQHRQFNIAPLYEMAPLDSNNKKKQQKQSNTKERWKNEEQPGQWLRVGRKGGGDHFTHEDSDSDGSEDETADRGRVKTHEEFYNHYDDDSDGDSDDEERPLRRSNSSSSIKLDRRTRPLQSILSRSEQCLNRTLLIAFVLLCFIFIRDKTPWWKDYKSRVALQDHAANDATTDPMAVYNTNDDDSTHTKDHDPTNKYAEFTAGQRISDRPAHKR